MNERDANGEPAGTSAPGSIGRWDRVSQSLVHRAASAAPPALAARLEEEWLADIATRPSVFSRLRFALGCCWATMVIAHELRAAVPLASTAAGPNFLGDAGYFSRRSLTLLLVLALHVALFFALMNGLVTKVHKIIEQPIVPRFIDPTPHSQDLPPPPPPALAKWRMTDVPPPEYPPVGPYDDTVDVNPDLHNTLPQSPIPPSPPRAVTRIPGGPGSGFPNTDEYYPSISKWKLEQGIATVRVCVDTTGRLTGEPITVASSGSARLDAGALQLAKAGSGHYRPTLEDGKAVNSCYSFRVRFELRN
jgi:protein TonB